MSAFPLYNGPNNLVTRDKCILHPSSQSQFTLAMMPRVPATQSFVISSSVVGALVSVDIRAPNEGSRRFHNHGEGLY